MSKALTRLRLKMWESKYPNCSEDLKEIFGVDMPSIQTVAKWKEKWTTDNNNCHEVFLPEFSTASMLSNVIKGEVTELTEKLEIHPYFWEYICVRSVGWNSDKEYTMTPVVLFYKGEHAAMFKMAWQ